MHASCMTKGGATAPTLLPQEERQLLQIDPQIDILQKHPWPPLHPHGGEVENAADAGVGQGVIVLLRRLGGDGEDPNLRSRLGNHLGQLLTGAYCEAANLPPDHLGIVVDPGDDVEGSIVEAEVAGEGAAEISHADDHQRVPAIEAEERIQVLGEEVHLVADTADAELAELREVLPDLGRREMIAARQLLGGDALDALLLEVAQTAQVEGEPVESER